MLVTSAHLSAPTLTREFRRQAMLSLLIRPIRNAVSVLVANDSPGQIAAAIALGTVAGFVPKGNLIAVALITLLMALRVNRTAGLMSVALFSWVGSLADGFTHQVGARVLAIESMQPHYAWAYELPLGPWIGFNNTVVLGSLLVGLYLVYPVYVLSRLTLDKIQPPIAAWLMRWRVARWLLGADISSRFGVPASLGVG